MKTATSFNGNAPYFSTELKGYTKTQLQMYCKLFNLSIEKHFHDTKTGKYWVPGVFILSFFRAIIEKIRKENKDFPITKLDGFTVSCKSTIDERIALNEDLNFNLRMNTLLENDHQMRYVCWIEVSKKSDKRVLFGGQFDLLQKK